jgi:hypothetical protein
VLHFRSRLKISLRSREIAAGPWVSGRAFFRPFAPDDHGSCSPHWCSDSAEYVSGHGPGGVSLTLNFLGGIVAGIGIVRSSACEIAVAGMS